MNTPDPTPPPDTNPTWGHRLDFDPNLDDILHQFCGPNDILGADCPNCNRPLLRILSLNATDPCLNIPTEQLPIVHLLYCWTCSIPYGEFAYKIEQDASVKLLKIPPPYRGAFGLAGPYDGYIGIFPSANVALTPLSAEDQAKLKAHWNSNVQPDWEPLFEPNHQIGGYPFIYNREPAPMCPQCASAMPLLAAISDTAVGNGYRNEDSETFAGNCGVQMIFHLCRTCSIVSAYNSVD